MSHALPPSRIALVAELAQRLGAPGPEGSRYAPSRSATQPSAFRARQMRMRAVALEVGREMTRSEPVRAGGESMS